MASAAAELVLGALVPEALEAETSGATGGEGGPGWLMTALVETGSDVAPSQGRPGGGPSRIPDDHRAAALYMAVPAPTFPGNRKISFLDRNGPCPGCNR